MATRAWHGTTGRHLTARPVGRLGVLAGTAELVIEELMKQRMGLPADAYEDTVVPQRRRLDGFSA
jgi:hypothetical protein